MNDKKIDFKKSLNRLNEIASWFQNQEEVDVEAGLIKVKEGAELVRDCKSRLAEIENEFEAVQKQITKE